MTSTTGTGPEDLTQFEDRVLYHLVDLTGDHPLPLGSGVSEADLTERLADELKTNPEFVSSGQYHASTVRGTMLAAIKALEDEGFLEARKIQGPWTIRPTRRGRRLVDQWRQQWCLASDRAIQRRVLEELEQCWRNDPDRYTFTSLIDVDAICADLVIDRRQYLANAQRLLAQGKVDECDFDQASIANGQVYITEAGRREVETVNSAPRPARTTEEAWVEVARLRRRLQLAERDLPSLVADPELRQRCQDLLAADQHYDRVIREACVILENRVRSAVGESTSTVGTALMELAFGAKKPRLRLSDHDQEQRGAMELYRGVMAFFRNAAGHNVTNSYTQIEALRFVVMIDLLLSMVDSSVESITTSTTVNPHAHLN